MTRSFFLMAMAIALIGCQKSPPAAPAPTPVTTPASPSGPSVNPATENATATPAHVDQKALAEFPKQRPADAVAFGGHWYKAFESDICWHTAKAVCEQMGGQLVCIETAAEQQFVSKLADGRYLYLGATDEAHEDKWAWINGAKWEYTSWMEGQPNNYGEEEHFLATYDGGDWVDVADEGSGFWMPIGFICEWSK